MILEDLRREARRRWYRSTPYRCGLVSIDFPTAPERWPRQGANWNRLYADGRTAARETRDRKLTAERTPE